MAAQQLWQLPEGVRLSWRYWDDEVVVYNVASQQTHLLDAFSAAVLREIEAAPKTIELIDAHLAQTIDTQTGALSARLAEVCRKFASLGLAEPSPQ